MSLNAHCPQSRNAIDQYSSILSPLRPLKRAPSEEGALDERKRLECPAVALLAGVLDGALAILEVLLADVGGVLVVGCVSNGDDGA